jgi:diacylglycerol O-acyltransferase
MLRSVDRPTALDLAFLDLETPQAPLHVGWTLRFGGEGGAPPVAALRRHLDARLHAVPRFRRRLERPALGAPFWADDPSFDVAHHVFGATLAAPGGAAELREVAGALLSRPLPADRPLWRMYLLDGLAGGGCALVGQAHHALVDGVAAIAVATLLFGPAGAEDGATWVPGRAAGAGEALGGTVAARARATAGAARDVAAALWGERAAGAPPTSSADRATAVLRDARRAVEALARPGAPTSLERSLTPRRAVAYADVAFDAVREAGRRRGATVNDVLLAATTLALRGALRRREEPAEAIRALVPVSVRAGESGAALGNRISFLPVELPVGEPDPERVLTLVAARTAAAKAGGEAGALEALGRAADALPGPGRRLVTRSALRAVPFTLVVSNVPGPPAQLALLGRPLRSVHPMVPLLHGHGLSVGAVSYAGRLHVGLAADAEVVEDVVAIGRDLEAAFGALRRPAPATASGALTPWRARAQARRQRAANR